MYIYKTENASHRPGENTCKKQVSRICNKLLQLNKKIDSQVKMIKRFIDIS